MLASLLLLSLYQISASEAVLVGDSGFVVTEVAGVQLGDATSGLRFISQQGRGKVSDDGYVHHRYLNGSADEVLDLVSYPGGSKGTFYRADVRQARPSDIGRLPHVSVPKFISGRGTTLGQNRVTIVALLGTPESTTEGDGLVTLVYRCSNKKRCPILKKVNMPSYEARYVFRAEELVEFSIGMPYP